MLEIAKPRFFPFRPVHFMEALFMNGPPPTFMGRMFKPLLLSMLMLCSVLSGCIFESEDSSSNDEVLAVFTVSKTSNVKVGDTLTFDGASSTPSDGSLTYRWNFDKVGSSDIDATGRVATYSYGEAGSYDVSLEVSDGSRTSEQVRTVTVAEAGAVEPNANIEQYDDSEDCEDNSIDEQQDIILWICAREKSNTDRSISETATVSLDGSSSESGDPSQYITEWHWDLDLNEDKDNDGNSENDDDLSGESVEWKNVAPGEYEVGLTVVNDVGMTDSTTIDVFVNYAGYWMDFLIGGNTSNNGQPVEIDFDVSIVFDKESGNTIRKLVSELEYPKEDDDWVVGEGRNQVEIYAYNAEDEEASNTSSTNADSRDDGDCDGEQDCIHLPISSYMFNPDNEDDGPPYGDGEWTLSVHNAKANDVQIDQFVIRLFYK
ncbi:MAG: hypothetical protein CMA65_06040 [Euryarchaeota archaeon]|nr:hypothetical protein [Euryarchaeota archaeon]